jgi:hypothetical protein
MPKRICLLLALSILSLTFAQDAALAKPKAAAAKPSKQNAKHEAVGEITGKELKAQLDEHKKLVLVEALEPKYYELSHLPGAIRMTEPETEAAKMLPDKSAEIVVYCMSSH